MAQKGEKLPRRSRAGCAVSRRYIKQITSRKARRLAKRLMEDAPPRRTEGWAD